MRQLEADTLDAQSFNLTVGPGSRWHTASQGLQLICAAVLQVPNQQCLTQADNGPCTTSSYATRCSFGSGFAVGSSCCTQADDKVFASRGANLPSCGVFTTTSPQTCSGNASIPACCCYIST